MDEIDRFLKYVEIIDDKRPFTCWKENPQSYPLNNKTLILESLYSK